MPDGFQPPALRMILLHRVVFTTLGKNKWHTFIKTNKHRRATGIQNKLPNRAQLHCTKTDALRMAFDVGLPSQDCTTNWTALTYISSCVCWPRFSLVFCVVVADFSHQFQRAGLFVPKYTGLCDARATVDQISFYKHHLLIWNFAT